MNNFFVGSFSVGQRMSNRPAYGRGWQQIRQREPLGVVAAWSLVLPLPEGKGWGEGYRACEYQKVRVLQSPRQTPIKSKA